MLKFLMTSAAVLFLTACTGIPMTPQQKALLKADLADVFDGAELFVDADGKKYLAKFETAIDAFVENDLTFDYTTTFDSIRTLEPLLQAELERHMDQASAVVIVIGARAVLRRLEEGVRYMVEQAEQRRAAEAAATQPT